MENKFFGNCGQPPEGVHSSVQNGIWEIPFPFARIVHFPGPFSQDRVIIWDGTSGSKWYVQFSSGWSINSENRLPL